MNTTFVFIFLLKYLVLAFNYSTVSFIRLIKIPKTHHLSTVPCKQITKTKEVFKERSKTCEQLFLQLGEGTAESLCKAYGNASLGVVPCISFITGWGKKNQQRTKKSE